MAETENKTIVFIETKRRVDEITRKMKRDGWPAVCIHGDKTQQERDWVLQGTHKLCREDQNILTKIYTTIYIYILTFM